MIRVVRAQQLWFAVLESQIETGNPYMLYKDACNRKSNQQNLGTIKCSNLCTEIVEYTSADETAVCNLASIALPRFVRESGAQSGPGYDNRKLIGSLDADKRFFDHDRLAEVTAVVTENLNKVCVRLFVLGVCVFVCLFVVCCVGAVGVWVCVFGVCVCVCAFVSR